MVCPSTVSFVLALTSNQGCVLTTGSTRIHYALFLDAGYREPVLNCLSDDGLVLSGQGTQNFIVYGLAVVSDAGHLPSSEFTDSITARLTF